MIQESFANDVFNIEIDLSPEQPPKKATVTFRGS